MVPQYPWAIKAADFDVQKRKEISQNAMLCFVLSPIQREDKGRRTEPYLSFLARVLDLREAAQVLMVFLL